MITKSYKISTTYSFHKHVWLVSGFRCFRQYDLEHRKQAYEAQGACAGEPGQVGLGVQGRQGIPTGRTWGSAETCAAQA